MAYLSLPTFDLRPKPGITLGQAPKTKTAGIIGGLAPQSTSLFYDAMTQLCLQRFPNAFPRLLINSVNCWEVVDILDRQALDELTIYLQKEMDFILAKADFVVMVCNSVHAALTSLREYLPIPIMAIHEEVCKDIALCNIRRVGILGTRTTVDSQLYQNELDTYGIQYAQLSPDQVFAFDACIFSEMIHGRASTKMRRLILEGIDELQAMGCEAVILGCTELPLFVDQSDTEVPLFPSTQILARAVVEACFGGW